MTDDPFAITERPIPLASTVSEVDLRAVLSEQLVRYGRLESEKEQDAKAATAALRQVVLDLLPVVDALERVRLAVGSDRGSDHGSARAVEGVQKMLTRTLTRHGVERMSLVGHPADPDVVDIEEERHEPSEDDGTVLEELVTAYRWSGEVVRRGRVVTSSVHPVPGTD
ncbi:nucleotide exchange factor GrpE [Actinomycetospora sp. CA-084318]|uniref:nucleotide exchange factor GrpE n=1 Tax=Actinomycetospora sp. CA-084318 TaxID=3239892 RepID=UPI003D9638A6